MSFIDETFLFIYTHKATGMKEIVAPELAVNDVAVGGELDAPSDNPALSSRFEDLLVLVVAVALGQQCRTLLCK